MFVDAIRDIKKGEELGYDYQIGRDRSDPPNVDEIYACRCGSPKCRGSMLWPPMKEFRKKQAQRRAAAAKRAAEKKKAGKKAPAKTAAKPAKKSRRRPPENQAPGMKLTAVVAASENDVIGRGNALPWHLPADLAHFKRADGGQAHPDGAAHL